MIEVYEIVHEIADFLRRRTSIQPQVGIILGTGLGRVADRMDVRDTVPYASIPHFPRSTVESHSGNLLFGTLADTPVMVMQGRFHYYEGYPLEKATLPVRVMRELGAEMLVVNSAAGGLNPEFESGDVMLVTDHINFIGANPLRGLTDPRLGDRFPDMSAPYDAELMHRAEESARKHGIRLRSGVYVAVAGPSLETRAETRMFRMLGGDAVGMSTVPEVIVAAQVGLRTLVLAAITNVNIPEAMEPISLERVIATARETESVLSLLVEDVIRARGTTATS